MIHFSQTIVKYNGVGVKRRMQQHLNTWQNPKILGEFWLEIKKRMQKMEDNGLFIHLPSIKSTLSAVL